MKRPYLLNLTMAIDGMIVFMLCNVNHRWYRLCCYPCYKIVTSYLLNTTNEHQSSARSEHYAIQVPSNIEQQQQQQQEQQEQQEQQQIPTADTGNEPRKPINLFTDKDDQSKAATALNGSYDDEIVLPHDLSDDSRERLSTNSYQLTDM